MNDECVCNRGYSGDGVTCTDVNECIDPNDNDCHSSMICINRPGSYECDCDSGFTPYFDFHVGTIVCTDIDECVDSNDNDCDVNADCTNNVGSFECACKSGFIGDGTQGDCEEIYCASYNCNRFRDACGGLFFSDPDQFVNDLITCLEEHSENEIRFDGRVFAAQGLQRGQINAGKIQFYEEVDGASFIFFDQSYGIWRIGGGSEATVAVDCTSVPIC